MGYRFAMGLEDDGMSTLLERIATSPTTVLRKPYLGYMFFLVTGREKEIVDLLTKQVVPLDAATGDAIAFVFLVGEFRSKVWIRGEKRQRQTGRALEVNLTDLDATNPIDGTRMGVVERLVRGGKFGRIYGGDELVATNYVVEEFAKQLGIADKIPCLVVFDAFPVGSMHVLDLRADLVTALVDIVRKYYSIVLRTERYRRFQSIQRELFALASEGVELDEQLEMRDAISKAIKATSDLLEEAVHTLRAEITDLLYRGESKAKIDAALNRFANSLELTVDPIPDGDKHSSVSDEDQPTNKRADFWRGLLRTPRFAFLEYTRMLRSTLHTTHPDFIVYVKTLRLLEKMATQREEVTSQAMQACVRNVNKYAKTVLLDVKQGWEMADLEGIEAMKELLVSFRERALKNVFEGVPQAAEHELAKSNCEQLLAEAYDKRVSQLIEQRSKIVERCEELASELEGLGEVSFAQFLVRESKRHGLAVWSSTLGLTLWNKYVKVLFKPQTIARIIRSWALGGL